MQLKDIDILDYWKKSETIYLTLVMMARDIFVVPMSTVPSESYFSSANRILTDKHNILAVKTFERLCAWKIDLMQNNTINIVTLKRYHPVKLWQMQIDRVISAREEIVMQKLRLVQIGIAGATLI
jgi:hAT family C-terminal dimerisation region